MMRLGRGTCALLVALLLSVATAHKAKLTNWMKMGNASALACQGEYTNVLCEGYEGIRVKDVFWGRDDVSTCQPTNPGSKLSFKEMCYPSDKAYAFRKVKEICQGLQTCRVIASPLFFDTEICPNVRKYVRVDFECRQMSGMKRSMIHKRRKYNANANNNNNNNGENVVVV